MKRICGATLASAILLLALPAIALAHHVASAELTCSDLTLTYSSFSSSELVTLDWSTGATQQLRLEGAGTVTVSPPASVPFGVLTVTGTWAEGSFTASTSTMCGTAPTAHSPSPPVSSSPAPSGSSPRRVNRRPVCIRLKRPQLHASIGPQGLSHGSAIVRAQAPPSVREIVVRVFGYGHVWGRNIPGHRLRLRLNVTSTAIWGYNRLVGSTFNPHARVAVTFRNACSSLAVHLVYRNEDGPRWR